MGRRLPPITELRCLGVVGSTEAPVEVVPLRQQLSGLSGQDLAQQPDVASKLSRACQALKNQILDPEAVSQLTGRLRRRVVLD